MKINMKKENLLATLAIAFALVPLYASAESNATTTVSGTQTEAQVFTACSQAAIEVRDNSIGSARTAYNLAMSAALSTRKDAEKSAVAIDDPNEKKDAIRAAVDEYKKEVTGAQDNLTKARKEAWSDFEANTTKCREASKEKSSSDKKGGDVRVIQATEKAEVNEVKSEAKSIKESIIESLKNFFKIGTGATTNQ